MLPLQMKRKISLMSIERKSQARLVDVLNEVGWEKTLNTMFPPKPTAECAQISRSLLPPLGSSKVHGWEVVYRDFIAQISV